MTGEGQAYSLPNCEDSGPFRLCTGAIVSCDPEKSLGTW